MLNVKVKFAEVAAAFFYSTINSAPRFSICLNALVDDRCGGVRLAVVGSPADSSLALSVARLATLRQIKSILESEANGEAKETQAKGEASIAAAAVVVS